MGEDGSSRNPTNMRLSQRLGINVSFNGANLLGVITEGLNEIKSRQRQAANWCKYNSVKTLKLVCGVRRISDHDNAVILAEGDDCSGIDCHQEKNEGSGACTCSLSGYQSGPGASRQACHLCTLWENTRS